ncbi:hypothetical protein Pint_14919 [Pistacia integerrima]|uniref:Uncharacterized protein n=1 Tax=Pistacia integerrima TaxID=434235 RepID=A0ACC0ZCH1_9ROSI|nr:hypothetical protein Pint_14919 [Pistacia integerrima]
MDSDVLAAEAVTILLVGLHDFPHLMQKWRLQAEANDEAERLISSQPINPTEQI